MRGTKSNPIRLGIIGGVMVPLLLSICGCIPLLSPPPNTNPNSPAFQGDEHEQIVELWCSRDGTLYLFYPYINSDGRLDETHASSPLNGSHCKNSPNDTNTLYTMSQARQVGIIPPGWTPPVGFHALRSPHTKAPRLAVSGANSNQLSLLGTFPISMPVPFGPPPFDADPGSLPIACDPTGDIYAVEHLDGIIDHVGTCPLRSIASINVGAHPLQARLTPDASTLIVTAYDSAVFFIDTATDQVAFTLNTSSDVHPSGLAISPDGKLAYVTNYFIGNGSLLVIDIAARQIVSTVPLANFPKSIMMTPDGSQLWINFYQGNQIAVYDTLSLTYVGGMNVGGTADTGMAFNPTGTRAFISTGANTVAVVDTATLQVIAQVPVASSPSGLLVTPSGRFVMVASSATPTITVIDALTNQVVSTGMVPVDSPGAELALIP